MQKEDKNIESQLLMDLLEVYFMIARCILLHPPDTR